MISIHSADLISHIRISYNSFKIKMSYEYFYLINKIQFYLYFFEVKFLNLKNLLYDFMNE
jgi:hypothetical protein